MPNVYHHRPLEHGPSGEPKQFRLLTIHGGSRGTPLKCDVGHYDLPKNLEEDPEVEYEALSWTWGEERDFDYILISGQPDRQFPVKPNLKVALEHLRHDTKPRNLWVDFVCIDQGNTVERASQVRLMFFIYSKAFNVCIWLGTEKDRSHEAVEFVKNEVNDLRKWAVYTKEPSKEKWAALAALMDRKWFTRRWVVQELALAVRASVHCSDDQMDWTEFETAVSLFDRDAARLSGYYKGSEEANYDHDFFGDVAQMGATRLVHLKGDLFRLDEHGHITERRSKLAELVSNLWSFDAQDPHDLIYAILSIAKDTADMAHKSSTEREAHDEPRKEMTDGEKHKVKSALSAFRQKPKARTAWNVDYEQDYFLLCKQFLNHVMEDKEHHNLDIILRPWSPFKDKYGQRIQLPSWIPTIERAAFKRQEAAHAPGGYQMARQNADPLVGQTTHGSRISPYNASQRKANDGEWKLFEGTRHEGRDRSLVVTGFIIDKIHQRQDASQHGNIPHEWLVLGKWVDEHGEQGEQQPTSDALWRTLVADRGPSGTNTLPYYQKAFDQAVRSSEEGINCIKVDNSGHPILSEFLKRMKAVVMNRRLFKARKGGNLGLAPKAAMDDDCESYGRTLTFSGTISNTHIRHLHYLRHERSGNLAAQ